MDTQKWLWIPPLGGGSIGNPQWSPWGVTKHGWGICYTATINGHFRYLQWTYQNWRLQKKNLRKGYMCRYPPNRPLNPTVPPVEVPYMAIDIKGGDLKLSYKCRIFDCNVWFAEVYSNSPAFHSGSLFHSRRSRCSRHVQFLEAGASEKLRAHSLRSFNVAIENGPFFWTYCFNGDLSESSSGFLEQWAMTMRLWDDEEQLTHGMS